MIANTCALSEAYNKIVSECYPQREASIKIRCAEYLNEYCRRKRIMITLADERFFADYFTRWLPYKVCLEDRSVIEAFYPAADEFVRLTDMLNGTSVHKRFRKIEPSVKYESVRLMFLKRSILEYNNSFIISKLPCVIDLDKYRMKKSAENNDDERDRGRFAVESFFSKNSVVLSKINGCEYYIRLFFSGEIMDLIKEKDVFDINIVRSARTGKWTLEEINGCYSMRGNIY